MQISEGPAARQYANAYALTRGRVVVSRKLVEEMSPDELDFILAHELAHIEGGHVSQTLVIMLISFLFLMSPMLVISGHFTLPSNFALREAVLIVPFLGILIMFAGLSALRRRREYVADRKALGATRNLAAAESALVKIAQYSPMPFLHDSGDLMTHPKLSKRITALRRFAGEIGLETAASEAPTVLAPTEEAIK
ncbi:MAG TPA: M48 family metalloprotease [Capsulimonadaceae bacterium]|nr:M48 family metalloprotease [Capsulimonadaceae bacterium]